MKYVFALFRHHDEVPVEAMWSNFKQHEPFIKIKRFGSIL